MFVSLKLNVLDFVCIISALKQKLASTENAVVDIKNEQTSK